LGFFGHFPRLDELSPHDFHEVARLGKLGRRVHWRSEARRLYPQGFAGIMVGHAVTSCGFLPAASGVGRSQSPPGPGPAHCRGSRPWTLFSSTATAPLSWCSSNAAAPGRLTPIGPPPTRAGAARSTIQTRTGGDLVPVVAGSACLGERRKKTGSGLLAFSCTASRHHRTVCTELMQCQSPCGRHGPPQEGLGRPDQRFRLRRSSSHRLHISLAAAQVLINSSVSALDRRAPNTMASTPAHR
jgi:hypothetical protein